MCRMSRLLALALLTSPSVLAASPVSGFIDKHCVECHDGDVKKGGLDLTALAWKLDERGSLDAWVEIFDRVAKGEMPPTKKARPEPKEKSAFLTELEKPLRESQSRQQAVSGRTVLRRLNRTEYENTVHDLLGIATPLKQILPEDSLMHGFDTVAEGLRFSQLQIEKYLEAADAALDAAIVLSQKPEGLKKRFDYKEEEGVRKNLATPAGTVTEKNTVKSVHRVMYRELSDALVLFNTADYLSGLKQVRIPAPGTYRIRISGYAFQSDGKPITLHIYSHNYRAKTLLSYCELPADKPRLFEFTAKLDGGEHFVINSEDVGQDKHGKSIHNVQANDFTGAGVAVQWFEVEGPLVDTWPPPSVKWAMGDVPLKTLPPYKRKDRFGKSIGFELAPPDAKAAISAGLTQFAARAFRRPLEPGETDRFTRLATDSLDAGETFENAMRVGLRALLTSPQFLLFEERPGRLEDFALASRLSYFLWSTMPDLELMRVAGEKNLTQPEVLRAQVERMLKSEKARSFTTNFVGQWLDMRGIDATSPDKRLYPEFDMVLKVSMVAEAEAFFDEVLTKNLPVRNFIDSDFVMLNRRLAEHYGIDGVEGEQFRRVSLAPGSPRGGVLAQAGVLKVTANGTVTSPVLRGAWVLKRLLGQPASPPPPNVGSIEPDTRGTTTIREQLAKHRDSETCASCHANIDPPGFALECFDVIGGWRETYRAQDQGSKPTRKVKGLDIWQYKDGLPVDASGELSDGRTFSGITEFKKLLLTQEDQVMSALASKLVIYSTGAGTQFADRPVIDSIVRQTRKKGGGLRSLVHAVVESPLFLSK